MMNKPSKEQRVLRIMRKVLGNIIKDATPPPGKPHPLSQETLDDVRECFKLIAAREAEIHDGSMEVPEFGKKTKQQVPLTVLKK